MTDATRRFYEVRRDTDHSGVSGTGLVAEVAEFSDGHAAIHWLSRRPTTTPHPDGMISIRETHGHAGATRIVPVTSPTDRLARIAHAHAKNQAPGGMTSGDCDECGQPWPCPTYTWATTDRDPTATWDPADDEALNDPTGEA